MTQEFTVRGTQGFLCSSFFGFGNGFLMRDYHIVPNKELVGGSGQITLEPSKDYGI